MVLFGLIYLVNSSFAVSLKDYSPYQFEVYFTNPKCQEYLYGQANYANDGSILYTRPKNVYCTSDDYLLNHKRVDSPHYQLIKLINDPSVSELFFTYLSFSQKAVAQAICDNISDRGLKVTFIIDSNNERRDSARALLDQINACGAKTYFRGNVSGLGFAHNKLILADYADDSDKKTIVYSSGNMSSGTILHHENWGFITTSKKSYFYQAHACLREGMLEFHHSRGEFSKFIQTCKNKIKAVEEDDIKLFIVPGEGKKAMNQIVKLVESHDQLDLAFHRFSNTALIKALTDALEQDKSVRLVGDDDLYWSGKLNRQIGSNSKQESSHVSKLVLAGAKVAYMQTNGSAHLLHHNKFIVFNQQNQPRFVFTGAGNFTQAAFNHNFENFYLIAIDEIVSRYQAQYEYLFKALATSEKFMPIKLR
jgi:phosphatidylserine/phosphatidylglycerophosphate/cardiolipin synthase-like enzyme